MLRDEKKIFLEKKIAPFWWDFTAKPDRSIFCEVFGQMRKFSVYSR